MARKPAPEQITRYADMLAAMGTEPRLRIMQWLLSAHPEGMVVGNIGSELDTPGSTLSHHLDKLRNEDLVKVRRDGTFPGRRRCRSVGRDQWREEVWQRLVES